MGESITEGTVSKWLKRVGDAVQRDEPLFEISTDKVDAEIPSPNAGVLAEIKVQEGQTVPVQTLVAVIETDAAATVAPPAAAPPVPVAAAPVAPVAAAQRAPVASGAPAAASIAAPTASPVAAAQRAPAAPGGAVVAAPTPPTPDSAAERLRTKSTPLVRKIAAEHQVDISTIPGSGIAGRVTKQDILSFIDKGTAAAAQAAPAQPVPRPSSPVPVLPSVSGTGVAHPLVEPWPGDRVEPFSKIRKITADHMITSRRTSAHVTSFFDVDFTHIVELRRAHKASYSERGANLTYLAFIAKACAEMLRQHPVVNAAVSGDNVIYRRDVNIGIAVALDWGLLVPVVKHADELSLFGLARAINDLGERARAKKLSPDEVQRGTFTITNPGIFGSFAGAPIINQPQVAILGVGGIEKRPRVITLPDGTDTIAVRTMGMLSMSYDHRVVDGANADRFLADVKKLLQDFPEGAV
jgi:2-oxoglutarate dehydrogenase E2 component (dihydrolipoamide succinyltransferase)